MSLAAKAHLLLTNNLDFPVKAAVDARAQELRKVGDRLLTQGDRDEAELNYLRVIFLGRSAGEYFEKNYRASDEQIRSTLEGREASEATGQLAQFEPLAQVSDERLEKALVFYRDRYSSMFPPALSRVKGFWYNSDLGAFIATTQRDGGMDVGGGIAPNFGIRLGTPLLARLHGHTAGFALWDDVAAGGSLGYVSASAANGDRALAAKALATYTAALGYRGDTFQILTGSKVTAAAIKIGTTTGLSKGLAYYGSVGTRFGSYGLNLEAWVPMEQGDSIRGAQLYLTASTPKEQYGNASSATTAIKSYMALRIDDEQYDACAAAQSGPCVDVPELRIWNLVLAFGAAFQ